MQADTKGDIYEGLLEKSVRKAFDQLKGAGQYFTPRQLIEAIVDCVEPTPDDTCDPGEEKGDAAQKGNNELRPAL